MSSERLNLSLLGYGKSPVFRLLLMRKLERRPTAISSPIGRACMLVHHAFPKVCHAFHTWIVSREKSVTFPFASAQVD